MSPRTPVRRLLAMRIGMLAESARSKAARRGEMLLASVVQPLASFTSEEARVDERATSGLVELSLRQDASDARRSNNHPERTHHETRFISSSRECETSRSGAYGTRCEKCVGGANAPTKSTDIAR